jgi:hypothetical protein
VLSEVLHPNQTAYLPGKQIQDNLSVIDMVNKGAEDGIVMALDAKKAFDSVRHDYIKRTLVEYGLGNFVPIFELLYKNQKVDIAINGDVVEGYTIRNGVKQGDALSCILFILCIDPLIWNIENNGYISRVSVDDFNMPKVLAYADDVTCLTDSRYGIKQIFKEYEKLSKASGLILKADKTEILDKRRRSFKIRYLNDEHEIKSDVEIKINGVYFNGDRNAMKVKNYNMLVEKITLMLTGWRTRRLSLLGKVLIYKTFGLSQITYVLTAVDLDEVHYRGLENLFYNFLWGKELISDRPYHRIKKARLCAPVNKGGFGMIDPKEVIDGIRCRQLGKLFAETYNHPLKFLTLTPEAKLASDKCLTNIADGVATQAHHLIIRKIRESINKLENEDIINDLILRGQLRELETVKMIKN